ncbi:elongation factor 4 [Candidatus Roizmanbacteria bacterium]|nr:elongation factor 4 [Candidatus Roizmanbacteria bacterium]
MNNIRNFAIIAHVDHGKSTLADRLLELTGMVEAGKHDEQMLDRNPISRERGITIKLAPVRMRHQYRVSSIQYPGKENKTSILDTQYWILNLIDTPGHVDFSYEVDRTLACVEGVILLVDATQGIQAQTIANAYKAIEKNLVIIPVVNKIDLPSAQVEETKKQIVAFLGIKEEEIFSVSAKTGQGVKELLETVVEKIPSPEENIQHHVFSNVSESLIFDSYYDSHRGVIAFARVFAGELKKGDKVKLANSEVEFIVNEVGYFNPELIPSEKLNQSEIGYVVTNLKDIHQVNVGDSIVDLKGIGKPLPGYKKVKPMVFASIFPTISADYLNLKKALEKLYLNDSALQFSGIYSKALGAGFRVGFLGLLHADVVRERLEREFNLSLILTPPQVEYKGEQGQIEEPVVKIMMITPNDYLGAVMRLAQSYRGKFITMDNKNKILLSYEMPMSELMSDFFDRLKSVSSGFASLDWEFLRYDKVKADKLVIMLNNDPIEEFSEIVVVERSMEKAQLITKKLRELIPRQQYEVRIQAKFKGHIIASERISPFRKDVLIKSGKVIGAGDVGRKKKLLEKQKEGKKRMKMVGKVEIPKEAFFKLFKR